MKQEKIKIIHRVDFLTPYGKKIIGKEFYLFTYFTHIPIIGNRIKLKGMDFRFNDVKYEVKDEYATIILETNTSHHIMGENVSDEVSLPFTWQFNLFFREEISEIMIWENKVKMLADQYTKYTWLDFLTNRECKDFVKEYTDLLIIWNTKYESRIDKVAKMIEHPFLKELNDLWREWYTNYIKKDKEARLNQFNSYCSDLLKTGWIEDSDEQYIEDKLN